MGLLSPFTSTKLIKTTVAFLYANEIAPVILCFSLIPARSF